MASAIRSLVNARDLQIVFTNDSDNVMKGECKICDYCCADRQPERLACYQENGQSLKCTDKGVDEKIDEVVLRWFGHVERMEKGRIAKRVYVGVCAGSH